MDGTDTSPLAAHEGCRPLASGAKPPFRDTPLLAAGRFILSKGKSTRCKKGVRCKKEDAKKGSGLLIAVAATKQNFKSNDLAELRKQLEELPARE